jgi:hypothetical protein
MGRQMKALEMCWRRVPATQRFFCPDGLDKGSIQLQRGHGGPACRTNADQLGVIPPKMQSPRIASRIEQSFFQTSFRVGRGKASALAQRAGDARKREVGLLGDLGQSTVFATIARALNCLPSQLNGNNHSFSFAARSHAAIAGAIKKEVLRDPPGLQPLVSQRHSAFHRDPACPTTRGASFRRLSAIAIWLNHRALRSSDESLVTYSCKTLTQKPEHFQGRYERSE